MLRVHGLCSLFPCGVDAYAFLSECPICSHISTIYAPHMRFGACALSILNQELKKVKLSFPNQLSNSNFMFCLCSFYDNYFIF